MEFHISRQVREKYQFDQTLFALDGNILFADLYAVRLFVDKVNKQRDLLHFPEQAFKTGQVNALGLIDEIFHYVVYLYRQQIDPQTLQKAMTLLNVKLDQAKSEETLLLFLKEFPPAAVFNKKLTADQYLVGETKGVPNRLLALEEMIIYWVTIQNPALEQYSELFESPVLDQNRNFHKVFEELQVFFADMPGFGPQSLPLIELLLSPAKNVPHSLTGQLEYIRENWAAFLGDYFYRILSGLDLLKEENKFSFGGTGAIHIPLYDRASLLAAGGTTTDTVAFSQDRDWMPGLVLIAKNTYVWLDQLSKKYQRSITRLDQIPDAEMALLADAGVTGLWLIGLWERSRASAQIKKLCGNPEAIASAYSLASYSIASDLGGDSAYTGLRDLAARFGIRLASDMVPNHMGIDSSWVIQHPDWFLSLDQCPYPSYSFNGPDLSGDPSVIIQIEDHYFNQSDAAVVFRRIDKNTGQTRFIYHGNDGTSMPWNDTAQLNYLKAEVREMVYQTILSVARKFPIIRFDAAMTLAKKQVQRLWFPEPGNGGAIPSRSEHALTRQQFDAAMPQEFWREVVDRIAQEAPDTLLLAEAFWMMEGYFVRSLGMHRVYNSAFMHMLRDENNCGYKQLLKNTLEFEPEILKRYVNFMNNPDEKTAVEQFGKGDKYFGVCTLMATFPGLPMLGHGQIEGFSEKYGMEYKRAYLDESVDDNLVERHRREIFPLLKKRNQFSGVDRFWLFDFYSADGQDTDNVFAFTNGQGSDHNLVFYNNNFSSADGRIKTSSVRLTSSEKGKKSARIDLGDCLGVSKSAGHFILFRDYSTNLQFIRPLNQVLHEGFHIHLNGYEYHVFHDFVEVESNSSHDFDRLWEFLGENGVPNIEVAMKELFIQPVLQPFKEIANPGYLSYLAEIAKPEKPLASKEVLDEVRQKWNALINSIEKTVGLIPNKDQVRSEVVETVRSILDISKLASDSASFPSVKSRQALKNIQKGISQPQHYNLIMWAFIDQIGRSNTPGSETTLSESRAEEWQFYKIFSNALMQLGISESESNRVIQTLRLITDQQNWYLEDSKMSSIEIIEHWFGNPEIQSFLQFNRFENILWYNREAFASFLWWMRTIAFVKVQSRPDSTGNLVTETLIGCDEIMKSLQKADEFSDFQVEKLLEDF